MACYRPLQGYYSKARTSNGKRTIVFDAGKGLLDQKISIPCGVCTGCRIGYAREWALRCVHESQLHQENCFITLTYNNEHLPENRSVDKRELQKFFKRLRKAGYKFRYFACGEYGDKSGRAHYHAILFGVDFSHDRYLWSVRNHIPVYRSPSLESAWADDKGSIGHCEIGSVTFQSCCYVARYIMKKRKGHPDARDPKTGKTNKDYYLALKVDTSTGEAEEIQLEPEFVLMSRRPGIATGWLEKYADTDLVKDFVTVDKAIFPLPRFYDKYLEKLDPLDMERRKVKRRIAAEKRTKEEMTRERLDDIEFCKNAQLDQLIREEI